MLIELDYLAIFSCRHFDFSMKRHLEQHKDVIIRVVRGSYSARDLQQFVHLCFNLALPLVRKKIALGKIRINSLGLSEHDVIYDCLADMFGSDGNGRLPQIQRFFEQEVKNLEDSSIEFLIDVLRRITFQKLSHGFIRLFSDADPTLGKILHNLDVTLNRTGLFALEVRMGEKYVVPAGPDKLLQRPPMPFETLQLHFSRVAIIYDSMSEILKKVYHVLVHQNEFQRRIPLFNIAYLAKDLYKLRGNEVQNQPEGLNARVDIDDISETIESVCNQVKDKVMSRYRVKKKMNSSLFDPYLSAIKEVLRDTILHDDSDGSFYDYLKRQIPSLTLTEYKQMHRTRLEYLIKFAKNSMQRKWKSV